MRRTTLTLLTAGLLAATAACSSSTTASSPAATTAAAAPPAATSGPASPSAAPKAPDAATILVKLTAAAPTLKVIKQYTAEDDPNHLLGRPGQYISKIAFTDSRIKAADVEGEKADSVERGGAVEVFASEADAKTRSEYIQGIVKNMPAWMEYDYVHGPVLVRVSRFLTPDQAKALQAAV